MATLPPLNLSRLQVEIVKLKLDKSRKAILERRNKNKVDDKNKGKHTEAALV
jgi:hypothetical protein